jgi:putative acetyltransferase
MTLDEKRRYDALYDMFDIQGAYLDAGGTFLVVLAGDRVVGTGALRRIDETTCEIRRLWLLRDYRSKGWGRKLSQQLVDFATARGYHTIRLLVEMPHQQKPAVALYRSLGFDPVTWLNDPPGAMIMEKQLQPLFQADR